MLDKKKVVEKVEKKYADYVSYVLRSPSMSKNISGESKAIVEGIVDAINEELEK